MLSYFLAPFVSIMLASGDLICSPDAAVMEPHYISTVIYFPAGQSHSLAPVEAIDVAVPEPEVSAQTFIVTK